MTENERKIPYYLKSRADFALHFRVMLGYKHWRIRWHLGKRYGECWCCGAQTIVAPMHDSDLLMCYTCAFVCSKGVDSCGRFRGQYCAFLEKAPLRTRLCRHSEIYFKSSDGSWPVTLCIKCGRLVIGDEFVRLANARTKSALMVNERFCLKWWRGTGGNEDQICPIVRNEPVGFSVHEDGMVLENPEYRTRYFLYKRCAPPSVEHKKRPIQIAMAG